MLDLENTDKKVKQFDVLLTSITSLLKKHWLILLVISIGALAYWVVTSQDIPVDQPKEKEIVIIDTVKVYKTDSVFVTNDSPDSIN